MPLDLPIVTKGREQRDSDSIEPVGPAIDLSRIRDWASRDYLPERPSLSPTCIDPSNVGRADHVSKR